MVDDTPDIDVCSSEEKVKKKNNSECFVEVTYECHVENVITY